METALQTAVTLRIVQDEMRDWWEASGKKPYKLPSSEIIDIMFDKAMELSKLDRDMEHVVRHLYFYRATPESLRQFLSWAYGILKKADMLYDDGKLKYHKL